MGFRAAIEPNGGYRYRRHKSGADDIKITTMLRPKIIRHGHTIDGMPKNGGF